MRDDVIKGRGPPGLQNHVLFPIPVRIATGQNPPVGYVCEILWGKAIGILPE
jgi:hypothetical protein